jgi:hypothetical protein
LRVAQTGARLKAQGTRILFGCWLVVAGYLLLVTCYLMLDVCCEVRGAGYWLEEFVEYIGLIELIDRTVFPIQNPDTQFRIGLFILSSSFLNS